VTVALLTFAMLLTGLDFDPAFAAVVTSINNTALVWCCRGGAQPARPRHAADLICSAAMLLRRLESSASSC
jgi:hypothetical protein